MNALSFLGYAIALALAPVAPFIIARWVRAAWHAGKALRVLSRELRTGETLYDCAEAIAGDAHNWRGMTSSEHRQAEGRTHRSGQASKVVVLNAATDLAKINDELGTKWGVDSNGRMVTRVPHVGHGDEYKLSTGLVAPQPPPQNSDGPALWPLIISELGDSETDRLVALDMQERHEFGMAKYGVPLVASNGRNHLADAYQELLDGVVYTRAEIERMKSGAVNWDEYGRIRQLYVDMLDMAKEIREMIRRRDGR